MGEDDINVDEIE